MTGSFARLRVDGPFEVHVTTGGAPRVTATGDADALRRLDIDVQGDTLVVRMGDEGWGERPRDPNAAAPLITVNTPALTSAYANAGSVVTIDHVKGQQVQLAANGSATLKVAQVDADQLEVHLVGSGGVALAGHAQRARLVGTGGGSIDAAGLEANDLYVGLDGTGETHAAAKYTAQIYTTGLGKVVIDGAPKCQVHAIAGGPVECGTPAR